MATNQNPQKGSNGSTLKCEAWEALLTDALDGTLSASDSAAFTAHSDACMACAELLEAARRGSEWLQFLREAPPAPEGLVERILAGTSGLPESGPLLPAGAAAVPSHPWLGVHMLQKHMAESRILMTLAMAFFSIALTLNLTGVRLSQFKLNDLRPSTLVSTISHEYFATSKNVQRYYSNLRFVYEVESRLNEIRQSPQPDAAQPASVDPGSSQPRTGQPSTGQPGAERPGQPQPESERPSTPVAQPNGKVGGSAQKDRSPAPAPLPGRTRWQSSSPMLARFHGHARTVLHSGPFAIALPYPGNTRKQSERSLV